MVSDHRNGGIRTSKFTLLIYSDAKRWQDVSEQENGATMGEYFAYTQALQDAGAYVAGEALEPADSARPSLRAAW